jgi:DNA replication protein DnaC
MNIIANISPNSATKQQLWEELCPPCYVENDISKLNREGVTAAMNMDFDAGRGIAFTGPTGSGKSRTMLLAMKKALWEGRSLAEVSAYELEKVCEIAKHGDETFAKLVAVEVLFVDDIFGDRTGNKFVLERILRRRLSRGAITIWAAIPSIGRLYEISGGLLPTLLARKTDIIHLPEIQPSWRETMRFIDLTQSADSPSFQPS